MSSPPAATRSPEPPPRKMRWRRLAAYPPMRVVLTFAAAYITIGVVVAPFYRETSGSRTMIAHHLPTSLIKAVVVAGIVLLVARIVERRSTAEVGLGLRRSGRQLIAGLCLGAGMVAVVAAVAAAAGWLSLDPEWDRVSTGPGAAAIVVLVAVVLTAAAFEELLFRAVLLRGLSEWIGAGWGLACSAALFGLVHVAGGASLGAAAGVALSGGVVTGAAWLLTGQLWLPLGIHVAYNFLTALLFGTFAELGFTSPLGPTLDGPTLWVGAGGVYGMDSGLLTLTVAALLSAVLLHRVAARRARPVTAPERAIASPDGRRIAYLDLGAPAGIPVLYLHGAPSGKREAEYFGLDGAARRAGVRLLALDRPGIGGTDPASGRGTPAERVSKDIAALVDALDLTRFAVLGYSAGAPYALGCSHYLLGRLMAVAVVSGSGPDFSDAVRRATSRAWSGALLVRAVAAAMHLPVLVVAHIGGRMPPLDLQTLRGLNNRRFADVLADALRQGAMNAGADLAMAVPCWMPPPAGIPLHVWHGALDRMVPKQAAERLADCAPSARTSILAEHGHLSVLGQESERILGHLAQTAAVERAMVSERGDGEELLRS